MASLNTRRFNLVLIGIFAGSALLLAVAGIYGVLAYSVTRRTREIGVRIALGASATKVRGLILRQAMLTALAGVAVGLGTAAALTHTMRSLLFEISSLDPANLLRGGRGAAVSCGAGSLSSRTTSDQGGPDRCLATRVETCG